MSLHIICDDIMQVKADAIVNTANHRAEIGVGLDECIYEKAGREKLLFERQKIGSIMYGAAVVTSGFALSKYIIHTVSKKWNDGKHGEEETLRNCYRNSLLQAKRIYCKSIAFPLLAAGNFGFPMQKAAEIAVEEITQFLQQNDMEVYLVIYKNDDFEMLRRVFPKMKKYIDSSHCDASNHSAEYASTDYLPLYDELTSLILEKDTEKTLSDMLNHFIAIKKLNPSDVWKNSYIDRRLFGKIRNNREYQTSKTIAIQLALGMELSLEETNDFLFSGGFALSDKCNFDRIIIYFLKTRKYKNLLEINDYLVRLTGKGLILNKSMKRNS